MSSNLLPNLPTSLREPILHELSQLRGNWFWFLLLGIATIVLGTFILGAPWIGTLSAVWVLSILMIASGLLQFIGAFYVRKWSGFFVELLAGILYVAVGVLMIDQPLGAASALTLLIAAFLVVGGIFRMVVSAVYRFDGWIWPTLNGVISVLLGLLIWRQYPASALWVIGLFIGIDMIFHGWTWVMIALALRRLPRIPTTA